MPAGPVPRLGKWRLGLSIGAAVLDLGALGASFLPVGATSCTASATAVRPGQSPGPVHEECHAAPTIAAFEHAVPLLGLLAALGLVPLLTLGARRRWPCVVSAVAQAALQVLGLGAFLFWAPAWLCTLAAAVAPPSV